MKTIVATKELNYRDNQTGNQFTIKINIYSTGYREMYNPVNRAKWTQADLNELQYETMENGEYRYDRI